MYERVFAGIRGSVFKSIKEGLFENMRERMCLRE